MKPVLDSASDFRFFLTPLTPHLAPELPPLLCELALDPMGRAGTMGTMFRRILKSKKVQASAMWIVAVVMISPFIFSQLSSMRRNAGPGGTAGIVFGRKIPWERFEQEYRLVQKSFLAQLGGDVPETFVPYLREQAWDRVILQETARRQVKISDQELARYIQTLPTFQKDGRFLPDVYYRYVRSLGFTPQAFEEHLRDDLGMQKLIESVNVKVQLSDEEIKAAYIKQHGPVRLALVVIAPATLEGQVASGITDEDLRRYYQSHPSSVAIPAKRTVEFVGWSFADALAAEAQPTDAEIHAYVDEHTEELKRGDAVPPIDEIRADVSQRIKTDRARKRLKTFALDLQEDREQHRRLEEIAALRQRPIRSAGPGEQLSLVSPNGPTASMMARVFTLPVGQLSDVLEESDGIFIVRTVDEIPQKIPPLEDVASRIRPLVLAERSRDAATARATQLHDEAAALHHAGLTFEEAWKALGIQPQRPEPFSRDNAPEMIGRDAAAAELLTKAEPGELTGVTLTPAGVVFGIVEERLPIDDAAFARDREGFRSTLLSTKQQQHLQEWLGSLRSEARLKSFLEGAK